MATTTSRVGDGGLAFPCPHGDSCEWHHGQSGMSLRDYFAAKALGGLLGLGAATHNLFIEGAREAGTELEALYAMRSYEYADALLDARSAVPPAAGEGEASR